MSLLYDHSLCTHPYEQIEPFLKKNHVKEQTFFLFTPMRLMIYRKLKQEPCKNNFGASTHIDTAVESFLALPTQKAPVLRQVQLQEVMLEQSKG